MFNNFVMQPMRKGEKIIDPICSNIPSDIDYTNVIPCPSRSDHDAPYIIAKIPANNFQPRCNYI